MNRQIVRLTYASLILVAVLVVMTTYWQTWAAASLAERQDNSIKRVAEFSIDRGLIFSFAPRKRLARNRERVVDNRTLFFRRYPYGPLAAHVVGYSTVGRSRTGLERSLNDYLTASNSSLSTVLDKTLDELRGKPIQGNDVVTTLDLDAQEVANEALGRNCGAVVALDPRSGRLLVMASSPGFDPNLVEEDFGQIEQITADCTPAAPLLNRGSAGLYVPGSTFKVVTAAAALESKKYTPESTFVDPGYCTVYGKRVNNFDTSRPYGTIDLTSALAYSVNSVFCNIGKKLGAKRILDTAKRFGFYERPPLETPADERLASGLYDDGRLFYPRVERERRRGPDGVRAGADAGDGAAERDGRRSDRSRWAAHGAPRRQPHRRARRKGDRTAASSADPAGREQGDGRRGRGHDAPRRRAGHGDVRADLRLLHRRQDRNGRDRRPRLEHHVVHRVRGRGRGSPTAARDRGRPAEPERHRRLDGGTDRPRGHAGNPAGHGESLTSRTFFEP